MTTTAVKKSDFAGVTRQDCCSACDMDNCVITNGPFCGHPYKSNIATSKPEMTARIETVRKIIKKQAIDRAG